MAPRSTRQTFDTPFKIQGAVQDYAWGKPASDSLVAKLSNNADSSGPFAELWFGSHPNGPSRLVNQNGTTLDKVIAANPEALLGTRVVEEFGPNLPFLFKVLSIGAALSIQVHPDLETAAKLHQQRPDLYKDGNHKPELAVALTPFSFLHGFRSPAAIAYQIERVPELRSLLFRSGLGVDPRFIQNQGQAEAVRPIFQAIIGASPAVLADECKKLFDRLGQETRLQPEDQWALRQAENFPEGDPGVFCFYVMNLCQMGENQGVYTGPNVPHAYLAGDIIELMANSDNVVRAGLTSKPVDKNTLLRITDFNAPPTKEAKPTASPDGSLASYRLPAREFEMSVLQSGRRTIDGQDSISMYFCLAGTVNIKSGEDDSVLCQAGEAIIVPASCSKHLVEVEGEAYQITVPN